VIRDLKLTLGARVAPWLRATRIAPNTITLGALLVMAAAAAALALGQLRTAGVLILVSGGLDAIDGAVARATGRESRFGALLDRVADRVGDFLLIAAAIATQHVSLLLGLYTLSTVALASYVSACLEAATGTRIGERLSLRGARLVTLAAGCFLACVDDALLVIAVVATWSLGTRLLTAYRLLR
jgi:CDP-diacylglycerol--glycerol-3-phosphate 3-phosphatidyltransferase